MSNQSRQPDEESGVLAQTRDLVNSLPELAETARQADEHTPNFRIYPLKAPLHVQPRTTFCLVFGSHIVELIAAPENLAELSSEALEKRLPSLAEEAKRNLMTMRQTQLAHIQPGRLCKDAEMAGWLREVGSVAHRVHERCVEV